MAIDMRETSESPLVGVYNRKDELVGIKKRGVGVEDAQSALIRAQTRPMSVNKMGGQHTPGAISCFQEWRDAPSDFCAVQVVVSNYQAATINSRKISIAATDSIGAGLGPYKAGVINTSFVPVTWNGAASPNEPAGVGSGPYDEVQGFSVSDIMPLESIPRAAGEGSTNPLVLLRHYSAVGGYGVESLGTSFVSGWATNKGDRTFRCDGLGNTDYTLTNPATITSQNIPYSAVQELRFYSSIPVVTIAAFGDSLMQGVGSTSGVDGYIDYAARGLRAKGVVASVANYGVGGTKHSAAIGRLKGHIATGAKHSFVIVPIFSRNDLGGALPTMAQAQAFVARTVGALDAIAATGAVPVIVAPFPEVGMPAGMNLIYQYLFSRVATLAKAYKAIEVYPCDLLGATFAQNYTYPTGLNADSYHPNDLGRSKVGDWLLSKLYERI